MSGRSSTVFNRTYRGAARLDGEPGHILGGDLLRFAETLVRDAGLSATITAATLHVLGPGSSTKVTGEAQRIGNASAPVWRVSIEDETGVALAEITLTFASDGAPAPVVSIESARSAEADDRRTRIALAARDVFAEKGYSAATMREVAAAAGMHVPTMYQYVRSKEELLELVYSWTITQAVEGMAGVLKAEGSAEARIDSIVRQLHDVNDDLRRGTLVMNRETRSLSRSARARVLGHYATMIGEIAEVIAEGTRAGVFREVDPNLAAVFIDALADVWVLRPFAVGASDPETYAAELVAFVRGALIKDAATTPDKPEPIGTHKEKST